MLLSQDGLVGGANEALSYEDPDGQDLATESIPVHPLGVKPLGNQFFASGPLARRTLALLGFLPDEMIMQVCECLDAQALQSFGSTCRFLYAFSRLDELWKMLFLELQTSDAQMPSWKGSWRSTFLGLRPDAVAQINCENVFSDVLHRPFACSHIVLRNYVSAIPPDNQIARLSSLTYEDFARDWDSKPFILTDCVQTWPVFKDWSIERIAKVYPEVEFRAEAVDWPFSAYKTYMLNNDDESPLYLFDKKFAEKMGIEIGHQKDAVYWPPDCFGEDLFQLLGGDRPAFRWLIVGPERSGSTFHKDPNATSAWNAVIQGSKYWLMFPPSVPQPPGVFVSEDSSEVTSPLSIAEYLLTFHADARRSAGCMEGICKEGEVLYVPSGWWHLVVNLEAGVALTQNFVTTSQKHLVDVLSFLRDKPDQVTGFSRDVESPYELFVGRLREKHGNMLEDALLELERKSSGKKRKWEEAVGSSTATDGGAGAGGFSFGFGGDDLDDDDIP